MLDRRFEIDRRRPARRRPGFLDPLARLRRNPLECWSAEVFREAIVKPRPPFVEALLVHEPSAIKHVPLDNAANYRKDSIQRLLSKGLADGLLSVEDERC